MNYTGTGTTLSVIHKSTGIGKVHTFLNGVVIYTNPMSISFDYGRTWKSIGLDSDPTFVYEPETEDDLDVMIFTYGANNHYIAFNDGNVSKLKLVDGNMILFSPIYDKGFFINKEHFIVQLGDSAGTKMYCFDVITSNITHKYNPISFYVIKYTSMPEPMELKHYDSTSVGMNQSYWCSYSKSVILYFNEAGSYLAAAYAVQKDGVGNSVFWNNGLVYVSDRFLYHNNTLFTTDGTFTIALTPNSEVFKLFSFNQSVYIAVMVRVNGVPSHFNIFKIYTENTSYRMMYQNSIFNPIANSSGTHEMVYSTTPFLYWKWQGIELFMLQFKDANGTFWRVYNSPGSTTLIKQNYFTSDFYIPHGYFPNGTPYKIIWSSASSPGLSVFIALTGSYLTTNGGLHNVTPVKGSNQTQQLRKINGDYSSAFVKDISPCLVAVNKSGVKEMYRICKDYDVVKGSLRVYDKTGTKGIVYGTTSYITQPTLVGYKERPDIPADSYSLKKLASILVNYIPSGTTRAMRPIKQGSDYIEDIFPDSYHFNGSLIGLYSIQLTKVESSATSVGIYYELRFNYINAGNGVYSSASNKTIVRSIVYKTIDSINHLFDVGVKFI